MHHIHSSHQMCLDHAGAAVAAAGTNGASASGQNGGGGSGECHSGSLPLRPTHQHIGTSTREASSKQGCQGGVTDDIL